MTTTRSATFHIALTADFYDADGAPRFSDLGLTALDACEEISYAPFPQHKTEISPEQLEGAQGVIVLTPEVTRASVSRGQNLLVIGRFGVGYDAVDLDACTEADVAVLIAAGAVDHSVAEATVGWMIALTHRFREKDALVRNAQWNLRSGFHGCELRGRTLGIIGLGGIGRNVLKLLESFGMKKPLAFDPALNATQARELDVELVGLDDLLSHSDFVSLHCPLTPQTRGMIGKRELDLMKPNAYLINTARGGIVDEVALYAALSTNQLAGAAIDCFSEEPLTTSPRLAELDNVLLAPHCIAWTTELFREIGQTVAQGLIDLAHGRTPRGVVNPEVFERESFQKKWSRLQISAAMSPK